MNTAFDTLARPIQKWVRKQGWNELRQIQRDAALYLVQEQGDLIVSATTAGGKTEAAFLPLLSQIIDQPSSEGGFDLVYVGPLKALITDQAERLTGMCQNADIPIYPWHGDVSGSIKARALKSPKGVLLITPESLEALFINRGNEIPRLFGGTRAIILDEIHTMLDSERGIQLQSLLARMEIALGRHIRRVGLSATLGDMKLAKVYMRADDPAQVHLIKAIGGDPTLQVEIRGYEQGADEEETGTHRGITQHLFTSLRGRDNLIFAGARSRVEVYADSLAKMCDDQNLPQEFYAHHGSLSKQHREFVEERLKTANRPTTAVCTSTLELGIDIGNVDCVAQIGAPFSVASLRQRMGRSGRREGQASVLRQYAVEERIEAHSHIEDRLRLDFMRALAVIELLLEGWCEPPRARAIHLSTLVHQILSVITERGGASAERLFKTLCQFGPFQQVNQGDFKQVLRSLGRSEVGLIEQAAGGVLLLGKKGERLVEHYSFYAVFQTPEEFRLVAEGKPLGTLPISYPVSPGINLIFAGRRWLVTEVRDDERTILLVPASTGRAPKFGGSGGQIHDRVIHKVFELLAGEIIPLYLTKTAQRFLSDARQTYQLSGLATSNILQLGAKSWILATRQGSAKTHTLAMALTQQKFEVRPSDGLLEVQGTTKSPDLIKTLKDWSKGTSAEFFDEKGGNLKTEKFHPYLTHELLELDAKSSLIEPDSLSATCSALLAEKPITI